MLMWQLEWLRGYQSLKNLPAWQTYLSRGLVWLLNFSDFLEKLELCFGDSI